MKKFLGDLPNGCFLKAYSLYKFFKNISFIICSAEGQFITNGIPKKTFKTRRPLVRKDFKNLYSYGKISFTALGGVYFIEKPRKDI